jgi:glycosyltransferase involved in cell wall biosynthesis
MADPVVVLGWSINGTTGWGLFGLHLGMALDNAGIRVGIGGAVDVSSVPVTLRESVGRWGRQAGDEARDVVLLQGLSNNFEGPGEVETTGTVRKIGLAIFEDPVIDDAARDRLAQFDSLIVPSEWCKEVLASRGLASTVIHQGFDGSVWHPAPRRRSDGRFMVFCGGKLEYRKGQDILIEAFKRFRQTPEGKDALLVTQWHNQWPQTMEGIWAKGYVRGIPNTTMFGTDIVGWAKANGVPDGAHYDLGMCSNADAANAIRECDVAVFPSRAEGATNMVLTECMALGLPCIVAQNTGQKDVPTDAIIMLESQGPVEGPCRLYRGFEGWGESDPDEIVEKLRFVRTDPNTALLNAHTARTMEAWTWPATVHVWREVLGV